MEFPLVPYKWQNRQAVSALGRTQVGMVWTVGIFSQIFQGKKMSIPRMDWTGRVKNKTISTARPATTSRLVLHSSRSGLSLEYPIGRDVYPYQPCQHWDDVERRPSPPTVYCNVSDVERRATKMCWSCIARPFHLRHVWPQTRTDKTRSRARMSHCQK